tara:strand:- start:824 stop:1111 length:288 start_codon:yes stop_codon:yes gene_type:complete
MTRPYIDTEYTQHGTERKYVIRTFLRDVDEQELVWHRDDSNRTVHVLRGSGWKLQKDDELPLDLETGKDYYILKDQYHRLLKGEEDLVLRIENGT